MVSPWTRGGSSEVIWLLRDTLYTNGTLFPRVVFVAFRFNGNFASTDCCSDLLRSLRILGGKRDFVCGIQAAGQDLFLDAT